jgi:hypothetical protein
LAIKKHTTLSIIIAINSFYLIFWIKKEHPFQQIYFNKASKIVFNPIHKYFELDYWGLSYKQGLQYLLNHNNEHDDVVLSVSNTPGYMNTLILSSKEKDRIVFCDTPGKVQFHLTNYRFEHGEHKGKLIHQILVENKIPILGIYDISETSLKN